MVKSELSFENDVKLQKITEETIVSASSMALVLGITTARLRQLVGESVVEKRGQNKYGLVECVRRYFNHKSKSATVSFDKEHTLLEKAKRETAELELAKKRRDVHSTDDIEMAVGNILVVFKRTMLSMPHKLAKQLEGKSAAKISEILTKEINDGLLELSQFDAAKLGDNISDTEKDD